jgi:hypothetical protein
MERFGRRQQLLFGLLDDRRWRERNRTEFHLQWSWR